MEYIYRIPKKYFYGSAITLIQEIILLQKKKNSKIRLNLISKNKKHLSYFEITKYVNINIKILKNKKSIPNALNLNSILNKKISYSLQNVIKISRLTKNKPKLVFKKKYIDLVRNKLKNQKIKKFICIHVKRTLNRNNLKEIDSWKKIIKSLQKNFLVIFLQSNDYKKSFIKDKNVLFLNSKNIYTQPILSQICSFFIASASGFCSFAIFSNVPYLLIKKPNEHKEQIKSELKLNKLKFASNKQYLIRENIHNTKKILSYVKKIK